MRAITAVGLHVNGQADSSALLYSFDVDLTFTAEVPDNPDTRARIDAAVGSFRMLEDLVRWGFAQSPRRDIETVVVQDEYSHDVVIRWDDRLVLVFDTT